ncbi:hypothetical protein NL676_000253 [Syzygium grande]|nr:hypothetical protein NL676_000253 [Syzygium grande]
MEKLSPRSASHVLLLSLLMLSITAREADAEITNLPGQPEDVIFSQYSGYVSIDQNKKLFYWLVEASTDADLKPLLLWLNGGPGCSSIGYGAFQEIGPFRVLPSGKLSKRQFSWNTEANLLFFDSHSDVGYSVRSVFEPARDNSTGNPTLDRPTGDPGRYEYIWNHGLISDTTYENMWNFCTVDGDPEGCHKAWIEANTNEIGDVNGYNIYARPCGNNTAQKWEDFCLETDPVTYTKRKEVQESFHVDTSYIPLNYTLCRSCS